MARRLGLEDYVTGLARGDRGLLARAITLIESSRPDDRLIARGLLDAIMPRTGGARRIGISGVPGVGKSSFIEALGTRLCDAGHRVAVIAVDPSSTISGGSILGDKARMNRLAQRDEAFIRPSPSARSLGGVARRSRETLLLCEAAGFDVVLVETVGVGQSETLVEEMVDLFLVLMLPGAGDELQGIKKGILELADIIAVNKADGDNLARAREAQAEYATALRYQRPKYDWWRPRSLMVSAREGTGLDQLWQAVDEHRAALESDDNLARLRRSQLMAWTRREIEDSLLESFKNHPRVKARLPELEAALEDGRLSPSSAAETLLADFGLDAV
ncbi:MAG: methylmalonyl Co-A mutase-associated GTPase MeaB [Planctomycetes bacterium]|nr:methylmalonyl Co-A mutase-associated GTPase MeaB [Planctomycetota bacterium]